MLCGICRKNQATKTYEQIKNGKKAVDYYCLDCYHRQFISADNRADMPVCPACGTTLEEVKKRNLVGCAYCYKAFQNTLVPVISKLQGGEVHKGKKPLGGDMERVARQRYEAKAICELLQKQGDFESAKPYAKRLSELENGEEKEDFVWRKHRDLSKLS